MYVNKSFIIIVIIVWSYDQYYKTVNYDCNCKTAQLWLVSSNTIVNVMPQFRVSISRVIIYDCTMFIIQATRANTIKP